MLTDATHFSPTRKRRHVAVYYGRQRQGYWVLRLREQHCRRQCAFDSESNPVSHPVCIEDSVSVPFAFTVLISPFFSMYSGALAAWPLDCRHTICVAGRICCCLRMHLRRIGTGDQPAVRQGSGTLRQARYPNGMSCAWRVTADPGQYLRLQFSTFQVVTPWCVCVLVY